MLADFDRVCGNVGLQLNLTKTMFMRNGQVSDALFSLNGTSTSDAPAMFIWVAKSIWPTTSARAKQEEISGMGSFQDRRGSREEDGERPTPCPPIRLHRSSFPNIRLRDLGYTKAG
ncbi:unnamed protein product [Heligmosomoides polygyrus]|uniref:Reverse transcriptase domain-containing protein n=1 Tax=Heligmosomoides polygyrus TaxID=6339 RepID=A0A183G5I6_HELPZ|nr:unnamed protein product [Heligmosomoides polygyrus]